VAPSDARPYDGDSVARRFVPTSDGVVVAGAGDDDQRCAFSAGAAVAPWQLGYGGPLCFATVASSHYVDIYDGAKSKSVWIVRDTVSVWERTRYCVADKMRLLKGGDRAVGC
jgi:hypothetical protein